MAGTTLPTPLYPIYQHELGFSGLTITVIFAMYAAGVIAALILFGNLSDQIGRKRTLLPGLAAAAASAVVFLLAHGLAPLLLARFLSGVSAGIFTGTATATLMDLAPRAAAIAPRSSPRSSTWAASASGRRSRGCWPRCARPVAARVRRAPRARRGGRDRARLRRPGARTVGPLRIRPRGLDVPPEVRTAFVRASIAASRALP